MLYIHDRHERGARLSPAAEEALRQAFFQEQRSTQHLFVARALLRDLHRDRLWLACDCAGTEEGSPMLGPRDGRGGLHPFRFGAVPHLGNCPFGATIHLPTPDGPGELDHGPVTGPWDLSALVPAAGSADERRDGMLRILRTALQDLGFDRVHASAFQRRRKNAPLMMVETPYSRLRHLGEQATGSGHTFSQVGCTFLPAIHRTYSALEALRKSSGKAVAGLFIGITEEAVPAVGSSTGYLKAKDARGEMRVVPVLGDVHLLEDDDGVSGPYWTIALIEPSGDHAPFRLVEAAAIPASDRRTLLPLPSQAYRPVAQLLLDQLQFWRYWPRLSLDVELQVRLFPAEESNGPPMLLKAQTGKPLSVSVTDEDHAEFTIARDAAQDDGLRRRLTAAMAGASQKG